jgi:anti-sigma regulatory factor (Ser/Thr protein kinase)
VISFGDETILTISDDGPAFDPREQPAPPAVTRRQDLPIGGLGLVIVRDLCTRIDYVRTPEQWNRLTMTVPTHGDVDPTTELPAVP